VFETFCIGAVVSVFPCVCVLCVFERLCVCGCDLISMNVFGCVRGWV